VTREYLIDSPRRDRRDRVGDARDPAEVARRKELEHRKLRRMIEYADSSVCLRAGILRYFGDAAARERCDACGSCRPDAIDRYERECVQTILTGIVRAGERYGRYRIVAMLVGDIGSLPPALTGLPTTGALRQESSEAIRGWLDAAIAGGLVAVSTDQYRTLSLTERGRDALHGRLPDLGVRRPVTGSVPLSRRRERIRDWNDWRAVKRLRRRALSADSDAPFEFDADFPRGFDAPDE
jgi:superfamily II DNA helicase RecQ